MPPIDPGVHRQRCALAFRFRLPFVPKYLLTTHDSPLTTHHSPLPLSHVTGHVEQIPRRLSGIFLETGPLGSVQRSPDGFDVCY
jgi:hypothetical protein